MNVDKITMLRPSSTQLSTRNESCYSLVVGVAKRAREIASTLCDEKKPLEEKPVKTAIRELAQGKFHIVEPVVEPVKDLNEEF